MRIGQEKRDFFNANGYLKIENYLSDDDCKNIKLYAQKLIDSWQPSHQDLTVFSTTQQNHSQKKYFFDSAENISFFLEQESIGTDGNLAVCKNLAINKIGHAMHALDPLFRQALRFDRLAPLIKNLRFLKDPTVVQSMMIFKNPEIGGEVITHQDYSFIPSYSQKVLGCWLAVDDASVENGCLWGQPWPTWNKDLGGEFVVGKGHQAHYHLKEASPWQADRFIPLEAKAGTLLLFHGFFPHFSQANRSQSPRLAATLHLVEGKYDLKPECWLKKAPTYSLESR